MRFETRPTVLFVRRGKAGEGAMARPFTWIASALFGLAALIHIFRLYSHFQIVLGSHVIPMWVSYVGIVILAGLSWMLCREARGTRGP
jgi:hypothetical protein